MNSDRKVGMTAWRTITTPITLALLFASPALALTPKEIMQKNDDARRVNEFQANDTLVTGNADPGSEKTKTFTIWRKVQPDHVHNNTLTRFHEPAEVRDEGILITENASGRNDVLMYLPNFKKVRRVESQQQSGSFMGSVFSYSDIATPHVDDYHYVLLKSEACPGNESAGITCDVIECDPANDDIKERTGYTKSVLWIRQDNFMGVHAEYYDLSGELFKKLDAKAIKMIDPKNKKWLAHDLMITNTKTKDWTHLVFSNVKVNGGISDSVFTQQNLQKTH